MPYYNPYQYQMPNMQGTPMSFANQQNNNGLIWVQGESGAKSYMVAPNSTVMLMDSESQRFYLKSTDASGMPQPLRIFEYTEKPQNAPKSVPDAQSIDYSSFATKAEFEAFRNEIDGILKDIHREANKNGKPSVQRTEQAPEG